MFVRLFLKYETLQVKLLGKPFPPEFRASVTSEPSVVTKSRLLSREQTESCDQSDGVLDASRSPASLERGAQAFRIETVIRTTLTLVCSVKDKLWKGIFHETK